MDASRERLEKQRGVEQGFLFARETYLRAGIRQVATVGEGMSRNRHRNLRATAECLSGKHISPPSTLGFRATRLGRLVTHAQFLKKER